jgi:hypothetical protein
MTTPRAIRSVKLASSAAAGLAGRSRPGSCAPYGAKRLGSPTAETSRHELPTYRTISHPVATHRTYS